MNRRQVLLGGIAVTGLATVGAAGLALRPGARRPAREPLRVLDERTFPVMAAIADRVCPGGGDLPSGWDLRVPEKVDELLDRMPPGGAADLVKALLVLESPLVALLLGEAPTPFSLLGPEAQDEKLAAWRDGRFTLQRTVHHALTSLAKGAYWSDPATFPHVGYERPAWASVAPGSQPGESP